MLPKAALTRLLRRGCDDRKNLVNHTLTPREGRPFVESAAREVARPITQTPQKLSFSIIV